MRPSRTPAPPPPIHETRTGPTISEGYVHALLDCLRHAGIDPRVLCDGASLSRYERRDSTARCTLEEWESLMQRAEARTGHPDLAVRLGEFLKPWNLGLLGYTVMSSATLASVAGSLKRFHALANDVHRVETALDGGRFRITLETAGPARSDRLARLELASWAWRARWLTGQPDLRFDADFRGPAPRSTAAFESVFGGHVRFGRPLDAFCGPQAYLDMRVVQQDPTLHRLMRSHAQAEVHRLTARAADLLARLESLVKARLGQQRVTLDDVAAEMHLPPRTLQSRLDAHGTSFRDLVERVRREAAGVHLRDPALPMAEIALMLGFASQTSFNHAFKRWYGVTPGQFRRAQQGAGSASGPAARDHAV